MSRSSDAQPLPRKVDSVFVGVSFCFLLSGTAGLVYQMVWMRYLSTVFGTSELAIVTVLVAYMGGLAAGANVASRFVGSLKSPIRLYAILEAIIALSALFVPLLLKAVAGLHAVFLGGQDGPPADGGLVEAFTFLGLGCVVLFIPTACMGATLPILAAGVVRRRREIGRRTGWLYALNTFGAVFGTLLAAFFLIPRFGLWASSFVGVFLNLLVAVIGWMVALRGSAGEGSESNEVEAEEEAAEAESGAGRPFAWTILGVILVSGAVSFAYEVLWSRLLAHVLGGSLYAFATMLAAFLAGIALGGLLGARAATTRRASCFWLAAAEIGAGLSTAFLFLYVSSSGFTGTDWSDAGLASLVWTCVLLLMPATLCIGATFPLAVRSLTEDPHLAGRFAGRVYSWNTVGAILGAVGAGYFLIPSLGIAGTFKWTIAGNLVLGAIVLWTMSGRALIPAVASGVLALLAVVFFVPREPLRLLTLSPVEKRQNQNLEAELVHHAIGRSASVAVLQRRGSFLIRTNGLPEAEVFSKGADKLSYTRIRWLPALPKILRPATSSMLVVGFGGGTLLEAVPRGIDSVDVIELEEEVIEANKVISGRRAIDPFEDERIRVVVNDARGALRLTDKVYDSIVSQPSHPWTAGASHLYTREFLQLVRGHLADDGVFVQWLGTHFVNEDLLRSFAATMLEVFPHVQLYKIADNFLFAASPSALDEGFLGGAQAGGFLNELSGYPKISLVEDVLAVLQLDEVGVRRLADKASPITDNRNRMATHQALGRKTTDNMDDPANLKRVIGPLHFLNQEKPGLLDSPATGSMQWYYLAALLATANEGQVDLARLQENVMSSADRDLYQAARLRGRDPQKALELLARTLEERPGDRVARGLDVQLRLGLARRKWVARGLGPAPAELSHLTATDEPLKSSLALLSPVHQQAAEAQHWLLTGQLSRLPAVAEEMKAFTDHRDPFYQVAARIRIEALLFEAGTGGEKRDALLAEARALLDHLLALPAVDNAIFMRIRIKLSQQVGDIDYLVAAGWIMARKLSGAPRNTPESLKEVYRRPLAEVLRPYVTKAQDGRLSFKDERIGQFYRDVRRELGSEVIPPEFRN